MAEAISSDKAKPSPTLNTILMVEDTLKNSPESVDNSCRTKENAAKAGKSQYFDGNFGLP